MISTRDPFEFRKMIELIKLEYTDDIDRMQNQIKTRLAEIVELNGFCEVFFGMFPLENNLEPFDRCEERQTLFRGPPVFALE